MSKRLIPNLAVQVPDEIVEAIREFLSLQQFIVRFLEDGSVLHRRAPHQASEARRSVKRLMGSLPSLLQEIHPSWSNGHGEGGK